MVGRKALRVVLALSCLFGVAYVFAAQRPSLADCCSDSCYAWSKRPDLRAVCTHDPKHWDEDARWHGYTVGKSPKVGAIVVFEAGVQGADWGRYCREAGGSDTCSGHVAYVEEVLSPVRFRVSEKGWSEGGASCSVHARIAYAGQGVSFIYENGQATVEPEDGDGPASDGYCANGTPVVQGDYQGAGSQRWRLVDEGDYVKIMARHSGKCLGVSGGSHANGAKIVQWDCYGGDNQRWHLVPVGDDYRIMAKHSGKCLDVSRSSRQSGAAIVQWSYHGGANQLWTLVPQGGDEYLIVATHSGRSMDVRGQPDPTSTPQPGRNQRWLLVQEGPYYRVVADQSDKCLDVSGVLRSDGAAVVLWDRNDGDNQLWSLVPQGDYYKIVAKHSGKCLDVSEASPADGAAVIQWDCNGGDNQLWKLMPDGEAFRLVAKHSGKYLSVVDGSQSNGAAAVQWGYGVAED